jgi:hypothetical protein
MLNSISKKTVFLLVSVLIFVMANFTNVVAVTPMDSAGYAIEFDGTNDYIAITGINQGGITATPDGAEGTLQYTAEGWFLLKAGTEGTRRTLWESTFYTISLEVEPSGFIKYHVNFGAKTGGSGYINVVTDVKPIPDTWHHVAVTVDARDNYIFAICYYDGKIISTSNIFGEYLTEVGDHINIGANRDRSRYFKGIIDEVRLWNVVRTQEELKEYMHKLLDGNEPGLWAYHRFDHTSGDISEDMTSNHYDGTWGGGWEGDYTEAHWVPSGALSKIVYATEALIATNITTTNFTANWHFVEGVTNYYLEVATDEEFLETVPGLNNIDVGADTSYIVTNLTPGTNYYYRVRLSDTSIIKSNVIYIVTSMDPPGNVLSFDGQDDYVQCLVKNFLGITGPGGTYKYTVETWFKLDPGAYGVRRTLWETEEYYTMSLEVDEYGYFHYAIGAEYNCESFTPIPVEPNVWNHVALIVDNSTGDLVSQLLYNGELADIVEWPEVVMNSLRYTFYLGTYREHNDHYFIGSMDEVRIWNVCRTEAEIRDNMRKILTGNEAGLACYYRFDHNSGDQLYDYSVNGNHGELRGGNGSPEWLRSDAFVPDVSVVEIKKQQLPNKFTLLQNHPNPFNSNTILHYQLSEQAHVSLAIYDLLGKKVTTLVNEQQDAGLYNIQWDIMNGIETGLSTGVYLCRINAKGLTRTYGKVIKMLYVK